MRAEKQCKYCAMMIPREAKICPHCRKQQAVLTTGAKILLVIIVLSVIPFFFVDFDKSVYDSEENIIKRAAMTSQTFASQYLKAPATADFPYYGSVHVKNMGNHTYEINSYVDSENSFGAKIRTGYKCIVKYVPTDKNKEWKLIHIEFDEL